MVKALKFLGVTLLTALLTGAVILLLTSTPNKDRGPASISPSKSPVFRAVDVATRTSGSAFLVRVNGDPILITNKHVCGLAEELMLDRGSYDDPKRFSATVFYIDGAEDICLLSPDGTFNEELYQPLTLKADLVSIFEVIQTVGYPSGIGPIYMKGFVESIEVILNGATDGSSPFSYTIKASFIAIGGQSGSPVVNNNGEVVGVLTYYFNNGRHNAGITPSIFIVRALKRAGVMQ